MTKIIAIIDGSNFYHGCKYLCPKVHLTNFSYKKFIETVISQKTKILYCVGEIKRERNNKKSDRMYSAQQSLFYNLNKQGVEIYKGFMLKSDDKFHEKGVDVRIAVEIAAGALKNQYDECYLFSSDTDIIPAIDEAKSAGKKIIYVGFKNRLSRAMIKNCNKTITIHPETILKN